MKNLFITGAFEKKVPGGVGNSRQQDQGQGQGRHNGEYSIPPLWDTAVLKVIGKKCIKGADVYWRMDQLACWVQDGMVLATSVAVGNTMSAALQSFWSAGQGPHRPWRKWKAPLGVRHTGRDAAKNGKPPQLKTRGVVRQGTGFCYFLVARKGFEPLISALRGRCPGPLDETRHGRPES